MYSKEMLYKLSVRVIKDIKQTVETGTLTYENVNINSGITRPPFTKETIVDLLSQSSLKVVVNVISNSSVGKHNWCVVFTKKEDHLLVELQKTFNSKVHGFSYALTNYITDNNDETESNEHFNTMLKLVEQSKTDYLTEKLNNNIATEIWIAVKQNFGSIARLEPNVSHELQPDETFIKEAEIALIKTLLNPNRSAIKIYINNNVIGYIYAREKSKAKVVIILAPTDKALESKRLVFELQPLAEPDRNNLTTVNVPSNRYPKEENVIKQEQGLPFDLEQLCNKVSNTCGSVHSLKETISAITQNQELTVQLERQKARFLLEVTSDIVSNWNAAVEFRFSPDLPVESLLLHFPERSVDINRNVVTFLNNCKLKYIHKTDVKQEHYLLSVELDDVTYNVGIPVNAVDFITILSAFGGRVEINTLLNRFRK